MLFCLPPVLLLYALDIFISKNLRRSNLGENAVWRVLYDGQINADIVINGASRAWEHINPMIITDSLNLNTYNIGINGYPFDMQYLRHELLMKYNTHPRVIIQSIDFMTFGPHANLFDPNQFLPYMQSSNLMLNCIKNYDGYNWFDCHIPFIRYYGKGLSIHQAILLFANKMDNTPTRIKGFSGVDAQWNNNFNDAKKTLNYYHIQFDTAEVTLFDKYLSQCKKDNIKVIFVYTPEHVAGQRFVNNRKQLFDIIHHFSKKYSVPLYDYSTDTMCYKTKYFYNAEHLNKTGAELFSKKFAHDLKRDWRGLEHRELLPMLQKGRKLKQEKVRPQPVSVDL